MRHNAPPCPANSSNSSTRPRRRLNNTTRWMPGIVWRPRVGTPLERKTGGDRDRQTTAVQPRWEALCVVFRRGSTESVRWVRILLTIWHSDRCPPTLKKMIFRTAIEEIIVRTDAEKKTLQFTIHWKGGVHTQLEMERPRSATETATPMEALEIIRRMAVRHGDDQIASVLNRLGYSTGKGKRWNQNRVATARHNYSIAGQKRALPDPERVSLNEAARVCGVSHRTIERLVEAGLLKREQIAPRAPWEIRRADLDAEPVRSIVERLRRTGKLTLQGDCTENQPPLFAENEGDDNARHHE